MDIRLKSRQIYPAVINLKQYTNGTNTLKFVLDNFMFDEINLNQLDAYAVTSIAGLIDETILTKEMVDGKLQLTWQVMNYTSRLAGAVTYQIVFKDSGGAVWYSFNAILVISESIPADDHLTGNYPSILRQWEDYMATLKGDTITIKEEALEIVKNMLLDYCSGIVKLEFASNDERWVDGGIGKMITIPTENMNVISVWKSCEDGSAEMVVTGVNHSGIAITIETLSPFDGFVVVSSLSDAENLTIQITQAMQDAAAAAQASTEAAEQAATNAGNFVSEIDTAANTVITEIDNLANSALQDIDTTANAALADMGSYVTRCEENVTASTTQADRAKLEADRAEAAANHASGDNVKGITRTNVDADGNGNTTIEGGISVTKDGLIASTINGANFEVQETNNIGSMVLGAGSSLGGESSTVFGSATSGAGKYACAFGRYSQADKINSLAFGTAATAGGNYSTAVGINCVANGKYALAFGEVARANGEGSVAIGRSSTAANINSIALGNNSTTSGDNQVSVGTYDAANAMWSKSRNLAGVGNIEMSGKIIGLAAPTENTDAANKEYVDDAVSNVSPFNAEGHLVFPDGLEIW